MALRERWRRRPRAKPEPAHFAYWRWDGTQAGFDLDADSIFDELADDLLYHGDLASALRRLMADGFEDRSGRRIQGLREMLERLRERRRDLLENHDLGGVYEDIAEALRDVVRTERRALEELDAAAAEARDDGDERRADLTAQTAATKNLQLDMLPPDLAGQFKALDNYDFESDEAR
ncbi:MAG: hypothetical protein F4033_15460, partial [Acidimicrobiaceae bacterium]|nr:hypothetical protein [Acidimicrobiaceae bacterium]MYJ85578.1 hypothetical protein [Acidimicrobiaceae bacterium]